MAKRKICPICGKEYTDSFFGKSEGDTLSFESNYTDALKRYIPCCAECAARYKMETLVHGPRFCQKVTNLKKARRGRMDDRTLIRLFDAYLAEAKAHPVYDGPEPEGSGTFCFITPDGRFCLSETVKGATELTDKRLVRAVAMTSNFYPTECFTRDDVTKLEYKRVECQILTLFAAVAAYDIRLNDEREMTYRPCIVRVYIHSYGIFAGLACDRKMRRQMKLFREQTGITLPARKVNRFK